MGEELQPSSVPQPGHPCCQVVLGLLETSLAMAVLSWGCEVFMLGPEHLEAPVLISLCLWGGGQGGAGGPQPVQALLLPHPSPGDRLVVWAGQAAGRQAGAAQGPSSASLHTPQMPKVMLSWHLPPLCHGPSPMPSQLQPQALGRSRALAPSGSRGAGAGRADNGKFPEQCMEPAALPARVSILFPLLSAVVEALHSIPVGVCMFIPLLLLLGCSGVFNFV